MGEKEPTGGEKTKTNLQRIGAGAVATAILFNTGIGCAPKTSDVTNRDEETEYSEKSDNAIPEKIENIEIERKVCDCCDYSTGGYAYHGEFDPQEPRVEANTYLKNGILKPDSHHWKNMDGVSIFVGKEGLKTEEDALFWGMRCKDEMPQILMGEKEYWKYIVVVEDFLDEREKQQLKDGELEFMDKKLIVLSLEDLKNLDEIIHEIEQEVCDCCDYSTGGYAYHGEFDPQKPRVEANTHLKNGILKPDSHNLKNMNNVSIFVGKEGLKTEEDAVFWGMRCKDEMPQILMGEKEYWGNIVVVEDSLDEREKQQLKDGELEFMDKKLIVVSSKDLKKLDEIVHQE